MKEEKKVQFRSLTFLIFCEKYICKEKIDFRNFNDVTWFFVKQEVSPLPPDPS